MEVPRCVFWSPTAHHGEGMPTVGKAYRAHTARALNRMCDNQEEVVRRVCYPAEVQRKENMCARFAWHRSWGLTAAKRMSMCPGLQAVLLWEEHMLATNRKCGRRGPILVLDTDFRGAAHGTVRWMMKEGTDLEVMHVHRNDMNEYKRAGMYQVQFFGEKGVVARGVYKWPML